jgi:hypothetical protein
VGISLQHARRLMAWGKSLVTSDSPLDELAVPGRLDADTLPG